MDNQLLNKCLKKGIRMTSQRQIIIGVIGESEDHPDVDELYRRSVERTSTRRHRLSTVKLLEEAGHRVS